MADTDAMQETRQPMTTNTSLERNQITQYYGTLGAAANPPQSSLGRPPPIHMTPEPGS